MKNYFAPILSSFMTLDKVRSQNYLSLYHVKADGVRPHFRPSLQNMRALLTRAISRSFLYVKKGCPLPTAENSHFYVLRELTW